MVKDQNKLPERVAFFSDAHLGMADEDPNKEEKVASFLRHLQGTIGHLYIVGDLFDFWFEYATVVPNIAPSVIFELYNLVRSGTVVAMLAGNHDYWSGPYLQRNVGLILSPDGITAIHQGHKIAMHHGDGVIPGDYGYKILKKVLRNRLSILLYRFIHPDLARWIALRISSTSRKHCSRKPDKRGAYARIFRGIADRQFNGDIDTSIFGHCHVPLIERREKGTLILLGDWITLNSYVLLEQGEFTLHYWNQEKT